MLVKIVESADRCQLAGLVENICDLCGVARLNVSVHFVACVIAEDFGILVADCVAERITERSVIRDIAQQFSHIGVVDYPCAVLRCPVDKILLWKMVVISDDSDVVVILVGQRIVDGKIFAEKTLALRLVVRFSGDRTSCSQCVLYCLVVRRINVNGAFQRQPVLIAS